MSISAAGFRLDRNACSATCQQQTESGRHTARRMSSPITQPASIPNGGTGSGVMLAPCGLTTVHDVALLEDRIRTLEIRLAQIESLLVV